MTGADWAVLGAYFLLVLGVGAHFARRPGGAAGYFLGERGMHWLLVMLSIVATETSALTILSVPGLAARGDWTFLQLAFGYVVGRAGSALWLLPGYFKGEQDTAYARLEARFGPATRRTAALVFMALRALGDSVRTFATAIPLALVTGWSAPTCILAVALVTLVYTLAGGIRAVIWTDCLQLGVYVLGGLATVWVAAQACGGLWPALELAADAGKLRVIEPSLSFVRPYTLLGGLIGGALLSAASHGTDHLIVQRLLATGALRPARRALVVSGLVVTLQFALFLLVGTLLWAAGADDPATRSDSLYPRYIVDSLPPGIAGLVVAGLLAAAMSTLSSSLNALASATTHDLYGPLSGERRPERLLAFGRAATVGWALVLAGGALAFRSDTPVVEVALKLASIAYGGLLGAYCLAGLAHARQRDAILALVLSTVAMAVIFFSRAALDLTWYVPLGTVLALAVGLTSSYARRARA
jgi:SSS family transporter